MTLNEWKKKYMPEDVSAPQGTENKSPTETTSNTFLDKWRKKYMPESVNKTVSSFDDLEDYFSKSTKVVSEAGDYYNSCTSGQWRVVELEKIKEKALTLDDFTNTDKSSTSVMAVSGYMTRENSPRSKYLNKQGFSSMKELDEELKKAQTSDSYDRGFGTKYETELVDAYNGGKSALKFIEENKESFEDYDQLHSQLNDYLESIKELTDAMKGVRDYYSQWENADEYKKGYGFLKTVGKTIESGIESIKGGYTAASATMSGSKQNDLTLGQSAQAAAQGKTTEEALEEVNRRRRQRAEQKMAKAEKYFDAASTAQMLATWQKSALGKTLVEAGTQVPALAGDIALSSVGSLVGVPQAGLVSMGVRAYGQGAADARRRGLSWEKAELAGIKSVAVEVTTEKLLGGATKLAYGKGWIDNTLDAGIEKALKRLGASKTLTKGIGYIVDAGEEGLEEMISDVINPIADRLLSLKDSNGEYLNDFDVEEMFYDGFVGFLLGLAGTSVNVAVDTVESTKQNKFFKNASAEYIQELLDKSAEVNPNSKIAKTVKEKAEKGEKIYGKEVKELVSENTEAIKSRDVKKIEQASRKQLEKYGEKVSVPELAAAIAKKVAGENISKAEANLIKNSVYGQRIVNELDPDNISNGENSSEWVHNIGTEIINADEYNIEQTQEQQEQPLPLMDESAPEQTAVESGEPLAPMNLDEQKQFIRDRYSKQVEKGLLSEDSIDSMITELDDGISLDSVIRRADNYVKETENNERNNAADGSMGREPGMGAGEQSRAVQESAGRDQSEKRENDTGGEETRRPAGKKPQREKVSGKSLNIPNGTDSQKLTVVKPDGVNARIVEAFSAAAKNITLVNGAIEQQKNDAVITVSGLTTADGRVFARADHRLYNGTKLLLHECGHLYMDDAQMRREMHNAAAEFLGERTLEEVANSYALLWKGLYKMPAGITTDEELADYFETNPDAYTEFLEVYEQEIWCDALAGLDRIKAAGASKLTDTVRSIFKDYTGIDVDAILSGADTGNTAVKTGQGKAERITPRNNGPPADNKYSLNRSELSTEERNNTRPDIDRADVVFSDDGVSYSADDVELNYENLVKKPDMILTTVVNSYGMSREDIVSEGKTNAASVGYVNESGVPVVLIKDTKSEIRVTNKGLRHGLRRKYLDNGSVTAKAGEILSNSIKINELSARKNSPNGSNVLIGAARRGKKIYIVRSIVSKGSNELEEIDTLYAIDTKIESAALNAPGNPDNPFPVTNSKISIAKLLEYVNRYFPDILPTDVLMHFGREARPNSSVSNSAVYSADDALLVEGDPDYADTLSKVREDARRYSAGKLEERISNFDGRIKGYEETENRTERMELELEDLRNRRKVYSDALKRKKTKNDERRQANETAKTEAKATAQRITEVQGRNRSKATLRDSIFRDFNIQEGRSEAADVINAFADKYAEQGRISRKDLNGLFDTLMEKGLFVAEAEDYARELRAHLAGSSVRVPSYVKAEFGNDWINFYRRAWGNKIYLKIDSGSNGIDTWTQELAGSFGEGTFDTSADLKTQLERIVELAEQGRDEKMDLFQMAEYVRKREGRDTADAIVDDLYQKLENAVKTYASNAKLEMELTYKNAFQQARDRALRQENARRAQEKKELRERQQDTLKQLQILKRMRDTTSQEFREQIDRVLDGIDTIAVSAANAMNYSDKYNATWGSIVAMYKEAKANDPNWLPDTYVDKLMERIDGKHLDEMEPADLEQLYQAAVALRTKIYNTRNIIGSETNMMFSEAYDSVSGEMHGASKPKNRYGAKWAAMRNAMNPNHYLECLAGWNPDSVWYKTFAKGLEDGERKMKRYVETSKQMLDEFVQTHKKWLEAADGQGKNGIWYEVKVSPVAEWRKGDQPIFGKPITVYMTPLQKVHMYLESKNYDNLAHMLGGRVFADRELYSKGNKAEAFASDPIHLARADVLRISSDLTEEEMELANILERYYNSYAKKEINIVSNQLYGFDRAMADNYAPIFTKDTYNTFTPAIIDGTAEGVGHMKTRIKGARTPTVNISAMDAFNKHVSQTSRFVGMSIPLHNMKGILNWTQNGKKMRSVIEQEWSKGDLEYIENLVTELQNPHFADEGYIEKTIDKIQSAYIGSVFGFNLPVALKVFGSWNLASAELGFENVKGAFTKVDPELIRKYTSEYDVRVRGYASPEVARLVNSQGRIEKLIQNNKVTKELFGGGLMIHTDALVARSLWAWSEAAVRNENPDLEVGTQEQIDAGQSPFYKAVAERYNTAIGNTQSMYDIMHRSALLRDEGAVSRAFTMFHTDIMQAANLLIKAKGEHDYYRKALAADPENKALQAKAAKYEHSVGKAAAGVVTSSMLVALVSVLNKLYKRRDEFYDENKEFMWDKFGIDYATYILKDFTGMLPGVDVVAGGLIDHFRGEKWYDVEVMGLSLFNDLVDKGIKVASKIIDGTATLEDYKDLAFLVARRFSLPLDNVERYTLGLFSWVAPEIGEAYNNMISPPDKSDLKGKSGEVLERDIYDMYKKFGFDRETTDELARLYEAGYKKAVISDTPDSITVNGEELELNEAQRQEYNSAAGKALKHLEDVISSNEYQTSSDKDKADMLGRLNEYAKAVAKAAVIGEKTEGFAANVPGWLDDGMTWGQIFSGNTNDNKTASKYSAAGLSPSIVRDILDELDRIVVEEGKNPSTPQKVHAIGYMTIPEADKEVALSIALSEKAYTRYMLARRNGVSSADYADFLEVLDRIDVNGGNPSREDFKTAVERTKLNLNAAREIWATYWKTSCPW